MLKKKIFHHLWFGDVDGALSVLLKVSSSIIKSDEAYNSLLTYIEERRPHICCYALGKKIRTHQFK